MTEETRTGQVTSFDAGRPAPSGESIAAQSRERAAENQRNRAVVRLQGAGYARSSEQAAAMLDNFAGEVPEFQKLERLWRRYTEQVNSLAEQADWTEEQRLDGAAALRETAAEEHQKIVSSMEEKAAGVVDSAEKVLYAAPDAPRFVDGSAAAVRHNGYRQALMELSDADAERLERTLDVAEQSRDGVLARAVFATARRQGNTAVAERYLSHPDREGARKADNRLQSIPSSEARNYIASLYAPQRPTRGQITPSGSQSAEQDARDHAAERRRQQAVR